MNAPPLLPSLLPGSCIVFCYPDKFQAPDELELIPSILVVGVYLPMLPSINVVVGVYWPVSKNGLSIGSVVRVHMSTIGLLFEQVSDPFDRTAVRRGSGGAAVGSASGLAAVQVEELEGLSLSSVTSTLASFFLFLAILRSVFVTVS